jgi:hypothetical protein
MPSPSLKSLLVGAAVALALPPVAIHAQDATVRPLVRDAHAASPVPSMKATARTSVIVLDGHLDDAAWATATPVTEFRQMDPKPGDPATQRSEFRILFDDEAVWIGARLYDSEGAKGVRTSLVRRDQEFNSDFIEIAIDGFHDHLSRAFFDVNPSGSIQDQLGIGSSCCDSGWDPVWQVKTSIDSLGWSAEIRIPLSQLRFGSDPEQTWGLQLRRFILRTSELDQWSWWGKNDPGGPAKFGHLEGLKFAHAGGRQLEVLPYVVERSSHTAFTPGNPFNNGSQQVARYGVDVKYLLSPNLTLDATFNPDFGQVEVDPAVINLSAFEVSFPEKRPFFVAGSTVFSFGGLNCMFCSNVSGLSTFYSRRIGRSPTGADLAEGQGPYADIPDAAAILGAAKITGRVGDGWTIGVLDAVTDRAMARVQLPSGALGTQVVEPLANYFVGRVKKDLMGGNLVLGGIATSVIRDIPNDFEPRLNHHSELVGTDARLAWDNQNYVFNTQVAVSNVAGDARDIAARQQSSARYFNRPDRGRYSNGFFTNSYDTTLTSLRGLGAYARVAKQGGDWQWEVQGNVRTPGFENNDIGFLTRTDYYWANANVGRFWSTPTSWYQSLSIIAGGQAQKNFDGDMTDGQLHSYIGWSLKNFWYVNGFVIARPQVYDDRLLRGGPVAAVPGLLYGEIDVQTNNRHAVYGSVGVNTAARDGGGWSSNVYGNVTWVPTSAARLTFGPSWYANKTLRQYVTSIPDATATTFFGNRYVFGSIEQRTLALDTRVSLTFTPRMTLEIYAQPFIATGSYNEFKEFAGTRVSAVKLYGRDIGSITAVPAPGGGTASYTIDPDGAGPAAPFTLANPDFNFRSLRGSLVFRWEYRPGSTLYVAWTHQRADVQPYGDFSLRRDFDGIWDTRPDNVFLVKATWWLTR